MVKNPPANAETIRDTGLISGSGRSPGEEWRNNFRKKEETKPKRKQHPVVDVMGDGSKV